MKFAAGKESRGKGEHTRAAVQETRYCRSYSVRSSAVASSVLGFLVL